MALFSRKKTAKAHATSTEAKVEEPSRRASSVVIQTTAPRMPSEIMRAIVEEWNEEGAKENGVLTYERSDFKDLLNGKKSVVLGRKGDGKTVTLHHVESAVAKCAAGRMLHPSFVVAEASKPVYIKLDVSTVTLKALKGAREEAQHFWFNMIYGAALKRLVELS